MYMGKCICHVLINAMKKIKQSKSYDAEGGGVGGGRAEKAEKAK